MSVLSEIRSLPDVLCLDPINTPEAYADAVDTFRLRYRSGECEVEGYLALPKAFEAPLSQREAILDIRCAGLALAIEFRRSGDCQKVFAGLTETGFLLSHTEKCILCKPPYVITREEILKITKTIEIFVNLL